ncbi:DUF1592 domain-containing protein, partial [Akkermansiaceae bacterium]|nr:DUF1592 domain-containing protein [Akkermansiaceae bacterium]
LNLEQLLATGGDLAIWEKILLRVDTNQMPPAEEDFRPTDEEKKMMLNSLSGHLDWLAEKNPNPGNVPAVRRLTRTEYQNAVRDLLKVNVDITELLPKDESSHGFDNITTGSLSPTLMNRYLRAAQKIARVAVGEKQSEPDLRVVRVAPDQSQHEHLEGLPIGTRGGVVFEHLFPVTGEYDIVIRLARDRNEDIEGLRGTHQIELLFDGEVAETFSVSRPKSRDHSKADAHLKVRLKVTGGTQKVGVTFLKESTSILATNRQPYHAQYNYHRHPRQAPAIFQVTVAGPFGEQTIAKTENRKQIFGDGNESSEETVRRLMRRAYRRDITEDDYAAIEPFVDKGIEMAISAILVSPRFLLRIENDPDEVPMGQVYRLTDQKLASRLSFFLWSSLPDEELLSADLSDPSLYEAQVKRMLDDPRADSLVTNFSNQWLQLRNLDAVTPDLRIFPDFDDNLRQSFKRETELFFQSILKEDRSISALLKADYTFLNERLATHYGIPHIYGSRFRRVTLAPEHRRGGLLRQGSILTVTSYATRTSPVIRGNWVLENILGTPAPPPPDDIPSLDDVVIDENLPMREKLAAHSQKQSCAICHRLMDPPGFCLEEYDAVGRWRTREVDADGGLPSGEKLKGTAMLVEGLAKRPDLFARTVSEKILTYALGRGVDHHDGAAVRKIVTDSAARNYRLRDLILGVTKSLPFTHRKKP